MAERAIGLPRLRRVVAFRLTPAGRLLFLVLTVSGAVAAAVGPSYPLYDFALFLFALALVDWIVGLVFRPKVEVVRDLPARCATGAVVPVHARVTNKGRLPIYDFAITERAPIAIATKVESYLPRIDPGETVELEYTIEPQRRGAHDVDGPIAMSAFPFGLHHTVRRLKQPQRVLVYPRFSPLATVRLPVGRKYQPGGLQLVSEVGDTGEFVGNRDYRPGDRLRDIHHAAWARRGGTPVVREFQEEYLCRVGLIADTHVPRGDAKAAAALEAAISLGAGVADVLSRQEYVIDIFAAGPDLYHFEAGRSLAHLDNILDILACIDACPTNPFEKLAPALEEEIGRISTIVAVLLDWDDLREKFVRELEGNGVAVKVAIVRDGPPTRDPSGFTSAAGPVMVWTPAQVETGVTDF